jgi:hypothetical protein
VIEISNQSPENQKQKPIIVGGMSTKNNQQQQNRKIKKINKVMLSPHFFKDYTKKNNDL